MLGNEPASARFSIHPYLQVSDALVGVPFNVTLTNVHILGAVPHNLSKLAQQSLKSVLNTKRAVFILTTNNISPLDKGMKDRCVLVEINAAKHSQYLPNARKFAADMNAVFK